MPRRLIPCLRCGRPTNPRNSSYCYTCYPQTSQAHRSSYAWQQRRKQVVGQWVLQHGWWCPGYNTPAHPVHQGGLTADHIIPLSQGGTDQHLAVLCGPCNSKKNNRTD